MRKPASFTLALALALLLSPLVATPAGAIACPPGYKACCNVTCIPITFKCFINCEPGLTPTVAATTRLASVAPGADAAVAGDAALAAFLESLSLESGAAPLPFLLC